MPKAKPSKEGRSHVNPIEKKGKGEKKERTAAAPGNRERALSSRTFNASRKAKGIVQ